jgi:hypothetical protein
MPTREEIIQALCQLDAGAFEDVINTALLKRGDTADAGGRVMPDPQEGPESFARWLAHRHLSTDPAIQRVVYLPTGAPNDEIRFLEINRFLQPPDDDVIEPVDFSGLPFKVFVADVTSDQWERIQQDPCTLPPGWQLYDNRIYSRD